MQKVTTCVTNIAGANKDAPPLQCLTYIISDVVNLAFLFLGAAALIFLMIGAVKFILAGGDPKAIKSAKDTMTYAVIGTALVLLVYMIAYSFVGILGIPGITFFQLNLPITP